VNEAPQIVFIVGPTASGKSTLAIEIAKIAGCEVINADSIQVYDGLDVGSAKPTQDEMRGIPHHLIGHIAKGKKYTAGQFRDDVFRIIKERSEFGKNRFLVVGGSGFYLKALMTDLYPVPQVPKEIQSQIQALLPQERYQKLQILDSEYAQQINSNDTYRVQRALEVCLTTGQKMSEIRKQFSKKTFPYKYLKIGVMGPKENLRKRIQQRTEKMLENGLIEEVQKVLNEGFDQWLALESVGYREVKLYLNGQISRHELVDQIVKETMALVKKQMTWFRKDTEIKWFDIGVDPCLVENYIRENL